MILITPGTVLYMSGLSNTMKHNTDKKVSILLKDILAPAGVA